MITGIILFFYKIFILYNLLPESDESKMDTSVGLNQPMEVDNIKNDTIDTNTNVTNSTSVQDANPSETIVNDDTNTTDTSAKEDTINPDTSVKDKDDTAAADSNDKDDTGVMNDIQDSGEDKADHS